MCFFRSFWVRDIFLPLAYIQDRTLPDIVVSGIARYCLVLDAASERICGISYAVWKDACCGVRFIYWLSVEVA